MKVYTSSENIFLEVILPLPLPKTFTYFAPSQWHSKIEIGMRVVVPFQKKQILCGIIKDIHYESELEYEIKPIYEVLDDDSIVEKKHIIFWEWVASYYMSHLGEVMNAAIPSGFKLSTETILSLHKDFVLDKFNLSAEETDIIEYIGAKSKIELSKLLEKKEEKKNIKVVQRLIDKEIIIFHDEVSEKYRPKLLSIVSLNEKYSDENERKKLFSILESSEKQFHVLMTYLSLQTKNQFVSKTELLNQHNVSLSSYQTLKKKAIFIEEQSEQSRLGRLMDESSEDQKLNEEQSRAFEEIVSSFKTQNTTLLYGVTSSGKTVVYQQLIKYFLEQGDAQVLYLVPEIALTTQLLQRLRKTMNMDIGVYHSGMSSSERVETWKKIKSGEINVVLGARSSLFLPFKNLKFIVIDEEHEPSFKQQEPSPRYHARDATIYLAMLFDAKVLMGSATPSVESYFQAQKGKFGLVSMERRYKDVQLPNFTIEHFSKTPLAEKTSELFEEKLIREIQHKLEIGEQVILFQNKRGFVPVVMCRGCGFFAKCKNCDVSMTFHSFLGMLKCHYCNYQQKLYEVCPICGSISWQLKGMGTQKVEEEVKKLFPKYKVYRMDSDTVGRKNSLQKIIDRFENKEIDILIGTQMIAKGLDFSGVTLIGIMCADQLWYYPDFRVAERAFQMLSQVGGRAGRRDIPGKVIVQTFDVNNHILEKVKNHDYEALYTEEIYERKNFNYPPFCSIIQIIMKSKDRKSLSNQSLLLYYKLYEIFGDKTLAPTEPIITRVKNYYIRHIFLKFPKNKSYLKEAKQRLKEVTLESLLQKDFQKCRIFFNVDPV